jgi:hypothetical protein
MLHHLQKHQDGAVFDPDQVRALTTAFEEAWKTVQDSGASLLSNGQAEATRELLALRIIDMARLGERDPRRLRDDALPYLARSDAKSSGL